MSTGGFMKNIILGAIFTLLILSVFSIGGCGYHHWGHGGHHHDCSENHCRNHCGQHKAADSN
jgi:hypothetical protein